MTERSDLPLAQPHNRDQKRLLAEALADSHERAIFVDTPTLTRNIFARNPLPQDNRIDDLPRGQHVVRVEDLDGVNVIFMPPIPCVMRDPDGQDRPVRITDTDDLVARIFAGWSMVDCGGAE